MEESTKTRYEKRAEIRAILSFRDRLFYLIGGNRDEAESGRYNYGYSGGA